MVLKRAEIYASVSSMVCFLRRSRGYMQSVRLSEHWGRDSDRWPLKTRLVCIIIPSCCLAPRRDTQLMFVAPMFSAINCSSLRTAIHIVSDGYQHLERLDRVLSNTNMRTLLCLATAPT
ncbi:hypothetical protein BD309DRAFT_89644 [Dichomitus squalens]|uniref:Uncharacterized protein n=1 Tax=Dichomitus squalens TaxID=114155 RepID=A0A4Q9NQ81_9APHY|nr:hypothetical protein BD309DRAFT_89644 [Dichomitus squalens]TBU54845.1 hypothetical protein BD310DRAFT_934997 [Dichomitus squalens]